MVIVKVNELSGKALDYAVAICQNVEIDSNNCPIWFDSGLIDANRVEYNPSQDWATAGPIIERERVSIISDFHEIRESWITESYDSNFRNFGSTPLIAAMRCYVASKMGESVEIPDNLL